MQGYDPVRREPRQQRIQDGNPGTSWKVQSGTDAPAGSLISSGAAQLPVSSLLSGPNDPVEPILIGGPFSIGSGDLGGPSGAALLSGPAAASASPLALFSLARPLPQSHFGATA